MQAITVVVHNKSGLHARPASLLVGAAKKFESNITIKKNEKAVNAKSMMAILSIGAIKGDHLQIEAEGADELEAIPVMKELFSTKIQE